MEIGQSAELVKKEDCSVSTNKACQGHLCKSLSEMEGRLRLLEQNRTSLARPDSFEASQSSPNPVDNSLRGSHDKHIEVKQLERPETITVDKSLHGSSSNDSFINQVSAAMDTASKARQEWPNTIQSQGVESSLPGTLPLQSRIVPEQNFPFQSPEDSIALMECFWDNIQPIFPILHRPSIQRSYSLLCQPREADIGRDVLERHLLQATLNIIFALGYQYDNQLPFEQRTAAADEFYQRSRTFISLDAIDIPTQSHVQLFLLTAIYLHSTAYANRCWDMVGAGLRLAQSLGLHREDTFLNSNESQLKREMRRRIWYCCVILDKMTATTFGRPVTLSRFWNVKPPQAIDDEFLQHVGEGCQPPGLHSKLDGFVYSLSLFDILDNVLSTIYSSSDDKIEHPSQEKPHLTLMKRLASTFTLNSQLDDLLENIPTHLKLQGNFTYNAGQMKRCFQVQAKTLNCRILYVRLLILRPWLLEGVQPGGDIVSPRTINPSALGQNTTHEVRTLCVSTAQLIIDTLYEDELNCFSYAAASILLAAAVRPDNSVDLESEPHKGFWWKVIQTLKHNKVQLQASSRAVEVLEGCRERLRSAMKVTADSFGQDALSAGEVEFDWAVDLDLLNPDFFLDSGLNI
ncbi:hypothetical protein V502_04762 [Pseudogymnoascus sp. VKM F-4520 (FW-2644)]|nr:hypothetical protein V502_04762 [Pseudogymnoascus sp. VKM F-4520 (FW-2644)]